MSRAPDGPSHALAQRLAVVQRTRAWRSWNRYTVARGNVLAGGMAYVGFFSLFPALAVGYTLFGLVVGGSPDLRRDVTERVNAIFGTTVVGSRPGEGVVTVDTLVQGNVLTVTGLVGVLLLLVSGLAWIDAMRQGVRAVFGLPDEGNPVLLKLQDVLVLITLGLVVLGSVVLTMVLSAASTWSLDQLHVTDVTAVRFLVSFLLDLVLLAVDAALFVFLVRVLARVRVPVADLGEGALIAAVGLFVLKVGGGILIATASRNKFLAATSIIVLLLWCNLASRLVLLSASWVATTVADAGLLPVAGPVAGPVDGPATGPVAGPVAGAAAGQASPRAVAAPVPVVSTRAADRVSVLAGAALGLGTVAVLGLVRRAVAEAVGSARERRGR